MMWLLVRDAAWLRDIATSTCRVEPVSYVDDSVSGPPRQVVFTTHTYLLYSPTQTTDVTSIGRGDDSRNMELEDEPMCQTQQSAPTQEEEPLQSSEGCILLSMYDTCFYARDIFLCMRHLCIVRCNTM